MCRGWPLMLRQILMRTRLQLRSWRSQSKESPGDKASLEGVLNFPNSQLEDVQAYGGTHDQNQMCVFSYENNV